MRFSVHLRSGVKNALESLAGEMAAWAQVPRVDAAEAKRIRDAIRPFGHTLRREVLSIGGVDGSGDYPSLSYGDSFVYVTVASGTCYDKDDLSGLRERTAAGAELVEFSWIPEDETKRAAAIDATFERMVGRPIAEVVERSDYRLLKDRFAGRAHTVTELVEELIRPHASDTGNLAIQLRTVGELSAALHLIELETSPDYVLYDSTLSLPFVIRKRSSLFMEHLKRLCCVVARERGVGFLALSKSHGLADTERIEALASELQGCSAGRSEHWYLRLPTLIDDGWEMKMVEGRNVPPPGAVTYLVRLHRNVPVMRLDVDREWWNSRIHAASDEATRANERTLFEDLDYASHDQRAYGYPYPIKAGHDRASLTAPERLALRKMVIDAAVAAGMNRSLFKNASQATGHA